VAYDVDALYIVVRCYDSNMRGVRASQLRRDADLSSDDNVRLLIDSFDDRRSAFVFATNPNGALWTRSSRRRRPERELERCLGRRCLARQRRMDGRVPHPAPRLTVSHRDQHPVRVQCAAFHSKEE